VAASAAFTPTDTRIIRQITVAATPQLRGFAFLDIPDRLYLISAVAPTISFGLNQAYLHFS